MCNKRGYIKKIDSCTICSSDIEEDNGDIVGYFGTDRVCFCIWCYSSVRNMIIKLNGFDDIDTLREMIEELKKER